MSCPCGSGAAYDACCGPLHVGARQAATPEQLMRSRYTAFTRGDAAWLEQSATGDEADWEGTAKWARSVTWLGLTIVSAADDTVEFIARYLEGAQVVALREKSRFVQREGRWLYDDGDSTVAREKLERNAPCPCGSGKKFKHCHA